jgi:hypothetical protein
MVPISHDKRASSSYLRSVLSVKGDLFPFRFVLYQLSGENLLCDGLSKEEICT